MNKRTSIYLACSMAMIPVLVSTLLFVYVARVSEVEVQRLSGVGTAAGAVVALVGLIVLLVYTRETFLLRLAAEAQLENSIGPAVRLDLSTEDAALGRVMNIGCFSLCNVGSGPAFNVTVSPFVGENGRVHIFETPLIECGEKVKCQYSYSNDGKVEVQSRMDEFNMRHSFETGMFPTRMEVVVTFTSLSGKQYQAFYQVHYSMEMKSVRTHFVRLASIGI